MKRIIDYVRNDNKVTRIVLMLISLFLSAILYNLFLLPLNLVTGGTPGIATITHYVYGINPALMLFLLSLACVIISFLYLGKERTIGTLLALFIYPILVQLTSPLTKVVSDNPDVLLLVIFAGVLSGVANGLMYKTGYSNGGFPIISQILFERKQISIAKSSLVINVTIVLVGSLFFGTTTALYAIIFLYINNIVLDKVLLGISNNKAFYIITSKEEAIKKYILDVLGHDVTVFDVKGGFKEQKRKVLMTVIPSREYYRVTEGIKTIDEKVFFTATDSYQVEGGK